MEPDWIGFPRYSKEYIPEPLTGTDIDQLLVGFQNQFGKTMKGSRKRNRKSDSPFKKKSIFFNLSYWKHNPLRHNLDAMHIEKNLCDNILGTLLNIGGMLKDHLGARFDLRDMGIRKSLHPIKSVDGEKYEIMAAIFDMTNKEKEVFCKVLKNVKMPYGCSSNVSHYVNTNKRKVVGYKSHDAHFILHYLLQFDAKKSLKPEVAKPLIRLSAFLRGLWSKVIRLDDVKSLQEEIVHILCEFEIIFLGGEEAKTSTEFERCAEIVEYHIGTRRNKDGKVFQLKDSYWKACHTYTLFNCDNKEIETLLEEHRTLVDGDAISKRYKRERTHAEEFWKWLKEENDIQDDIIEVKKTRDKEIVECPPVNGYELGRLRRVQENKEKFKELGLGKYAANPNLPNVKESKRKKKDGEESDEYIVENESGDDSDDSSERIKIVKEKKTVPGPRTRSRANATDLGDKDLAHAIEKKGKKVAPARNYATLLKPTCSKLLNQGDKSIQSGTVAAYIALRESQRKDLEGDRRICDVGETSLPNADDEADEEVQPAPKKRRGRTKMLKVHGRSTDEKKAIKLSNRGQLIGDRKLTFLKKLLFFASFTIVFNSLHLDLCFLP
ncbi:hypothetical protein POM88_001712 [Heracleum sosnowskyi]|uniref:Transposase n=1 Tax=Heracleum sosnowskyi TaxID=360622 RepID=A0AAD8NAP0_9APIA|nr:hypothetical protein POM88_001712 [Heracleum sosnowskyi]